VLGDKSNHIATLHLPQMLYLWIYTTFFSWPILYPIFVKLISSVIPATIAQYLYRIPGVRWCRTQSTLPPVFIIFIGIFSALAALVMHFNFIVHPFTLADNRHYVFYVFRILRIPGLRYAVTPAFSICFWACIDAMGSSYDSRNAGVKTSFALIWIVTTALTLCTAPLVEPRYFILPWLMWRLHLPDKTPIENTRASSKSIWLRYDHQLTLETLWYLAINGGTAYTFLFRGFEWPQEPGQIQRFMW
jgi:alpha-1,2-glucosyltransferase